MSPQPGEVWLADLGLAAKTRPVVIVSRFDPEAPRALVVYVPLTTQNRESAYEVPIPKQGFLNAISVANVQGIASLPTIRLERRLGTLSTGTMAEIRRALLFTLDLGNIPRWFPSLSLGSTPGHRPGK
jgi:mRNA interferase MazF